MRILKVFTFISLAILLIAVGQKLGNFSKVSTMQLQEHPGYYEQWLREKMPSSGVFPHWMRESWARWDRMQVGNRAASDLIDTVYQLGPADIGVEPVLCGYIQPMKISYWQRQFLEACGAVKMGVKVGHH